MKRERLNTLEMNQGKHPRKRKPMVFSYDPESREKRYERLAGDRKRSHKRRCEKAAAAALTPADPTFVQLLEMITLRRKQQDDAGAMLSGYLTTGTTRRTIIRERLPARDPHPEK